jgi:anti-sigma B factor antagonist
MMMLSTRLHPLGFTIADLESDQFEYPKTSVLKQQLMQVLTRHSPFLALNLTNVNFLDSFGLAVLISVMRTCAEKKGQCMLYGLTDPVKRLIDLTHMDKVLAIWTTEGQVAFKMQEALAEKARQDALPKTPKGLHTPNSF